MNKQNITSTSYTYFRRRKTFVILFLFVITLTMGILSLVIGSSEIHLFDVIKTLFGYGTQHTNIIILGIRLPRTLASILIGAGLAMSGAVMQSVLRNPLASASTLGVSQGAAFGAAFGIIILGAGIQNTSSTSPIVINNPYIVTICAFIGGSISTLVILLLSRFKNLSSEALILAGVALGSLFTGGSTLLQYFAEDVQVAAVVFWTFGDLGRTNTKELVLLTICTLLSFIYFMFNRWNYNALGNGKHTAKSLGVNVNKTILLSMCVCSLLSAIGVAFVGIISFIGLISPHVMRIFVGNDYRYLVPTSALFGAFLLLIADTFGRMIVSPIILPIGAITSFLGAPMFLYLLFNSSSKK